MKTLFYFTFFIILSSLLFLPAHLINAADTAPSGNFLTGVGNQINSYKDQGGANAETTLQTKIAGIINAVLGWIAVILVIIVIYSGFLWLTAGGNPEQVKKAKSWIINATIGTIIVAAAYLITNFIITLI